MNAHCKVGSRKCDINFVNRVVQDTSVCRILYLWRISRIMIGPQRLIFCSHSRSQMKISEQCYVTIRNFIIDILLSEGEITFSELLARAEERNTFLLGSSTAWYVLKIKQDLEARKIIKIKRVSENRMQLITINRSQYLRSTLIEEQPLVN